MQSHYAQAFEREMACTQQDWLRWLPGAIGAHPWQSGLGWARIEIDEGALRIEWRVGEPRRIAMVTMPRLCVSFSFDRQDESQRLAFMRRFDLHMQRGGG